MIPSFLKVSTISALGVAGTAGTVYLGSKAVNFSGVEEENDELIETFKDKFNGRLVTAKFSDSKGKDRLDKLNKAKSGTPKKENLPEAKKQEDLHKGCKDTSITAFDAKSEKVFEDYCVLMNKEQISKKLIQVDGVWKDANERLHKAEDSKLSKEMQEVKKKLKDKLDSAEDLKDGCTTRYDLPYKGNKDQDFVDMRLYCIEVKKSEPIAPSSGS